MINEAEDTLLSDFQNFVSGNKLFTQQEKVLIAVSGGLDSVVLTDLISKSTSEFAIAHCNFSLRGEESDDDENFVRELAQKYNCRFFTTRFDTNQYAAENHKSIQEAARDLRYNDFKSICREFKYDKIATAHHLNDSVETFFINLLRKSGPAGLRGIPPVKENIIRPMLFTTRDNIISYAKQNNIIYREDSSNATDKYQRNKIRHHLIPALENYIPGFLSLMSETMESFGCIHDEFINETNEWKKKNTTIDTRGNIHIDLKKINSEFSPESFLSDILYSEGITGINCRKVLQVQCSGKIFHSVTHQILYDRDQLIISSVKINEVESVQITSLPFLMHNDSIEVHISEADNPENSTEVYFTDFDKIKLPLLLRTWMPGDFFYPAGMAGKKKVSDYFIDKKLDRFEKDKTFILLSGNDIVCILGHRIDGRFNVRESTTKFLRIEFRRNQ